MTEHPHESDYSAKLSRMETLLTVEQNDTTATGAGVNPYDPFVSSSSSLTGAGNLGHKAQINPYAQDAGPMAGSAYYQGQGNYTQPLQYHLYAPLGPHREHLLAYHRTAHDFFISDSLREDLQRKAEASLQVLPNSTLPSIDYFHSLVPLDTTNQKNAAIFGYPSWIYKAMSGKDGIIYALRRLEGYRLTNEKAIRSVQAWKRVHSGSVVTVHDAFTTRAFGDSSLVFVTDYHPLSKTLAEHHFGPTSRYTGRPSGAHIPEQVLWSYIVQIASALKTIHSAGLAARLLDASKILLTSKNRVRLNACAIFDVTQHDTQLNIMELQQEDLVQFGRLILTIASSNPAAIHNMPKSLEHIARSYSVQLKDCVFWLLGVTQPSQTPKNLDQFISGISSHIITSFDHTLHLDDQLNTELNRELENARILRLMTKLNFINERPEFEHDRQWSETGERYFLKLFRDFVFHQVDAQGAPVVDLAHVLTCLAKLDAGIEERLTLVSRDEQNCFVVSYKEVKRGVENAFSELMKSGRRV
ncbi:MAG: PAB-dependent poly(A)-specific ribonuclease subunit 3 [Pycnora praestabilis]|nr:MAG: PAB-dependent poly(A)-specific ribonuclease subunit 3 [Pycnora praestabilis]